jgi:hypothetical protein
METRNQEPIRAMNDDAEVLFALQMACEHDINHQAQALRTWLPRITKWYESRHPSPVAQGEAVEIHGWVACERPGYPFTRAESYQLVYCQRNSDGQFFKFYLPVIPAAPPKPTAPDGGGL